MIHHIPHQEIDMDKWDACIRDSINGSLYAQSWYLDLVSGGNWDALVDDDYRSVMPLPWRKKFGLKYVYQPLFTQQLGLFSIDLLGTERVTAFIDSIPGEFVLVDQNMNKLASLLRDNRVRLDNDNFELELISSYEGLVQEYKENLKRNLKKAEGHGLSFIRNVNPETVIKLFRLNRGRKLKSWGEPEYLTLKHLIYQMLHKQLATTIGVFDQRNELCAGAFFAEYGDRSIFLFSGLSEEGKNLQAMPFLIDKYIQLHAGTQKILDFEGSNDPGLARFYSSFGSKKHQYQSIRINRLPRLLKPGFWLYNRWKP